MTPSKDSCPREYWAFRFGRLAVQLPRVIEQAYIHDSLPIDEPAVEDKPDHPRDKFPSVDRVFADIEEALINLRDNGPSNLKKSAVDALKAFDEFKRLILHALADGDAEVVANHFSFLQDECLPRRGQSFDDSALREFLAIFRGDDKPPRLEKLKPGRPRKPVATPKESQLPLTSNAWNNFNNKIQAVSKRLNKFVVLYNLGKALEEASDPQHLKSMTAQHDKANNEFYRELSDVVEESLELLASLGVETADLAWNVSSERDFGTRLRLTLEELEEQLVSFEWKNDPSDVAVPEFKSMKSLSWEEVSIAIEKPDATIDPWIVIKARGVSVKKRASELGFFTEHGKPATRLTTLAKFCRSKGFIRWSDSKATVNVRKRLEDAENDIQVSERIDREGYREELGGDEDTLESIEGESEVASRARLTPPVEKHQVHLIRKHLNGLLGIDEDPFYPYHRPEGETVERRSQSGKQLPPRQLKGFKLKCSCKLNE